MNIDMNNMTPELKAALVQELISSTFSSKAIHAVGDNLAKGIFKLASATQTTTDITARWSGTAEAMAIPTAKRAISTAQALVADLSGRVAAGVSAGYKAATTSKAEVIDSRAFGAFENCSRYASQKRSTGSVIKIAT
jgi:type IV secretory pathway TrbL component